MSAPDNAVASARARLRVLIAELQAGTPLGVSDAPCESCGRRGRELRAVVVGGEVFGVCRYCSEVADPEMEWT